MSFMTTAMLPHTLVSNHSSCESPSLLNLLIVDDDRPSRVACREAAAVLGCSATMADSAEEGLMIIESRDIDLVLLGLRITDAARLQLLRRVKQRNPRLEVAIMTTSTAAQPAIDAMKAGAWDCLIKPFDLKELRALLERVASQVKVRIANRQLSEQIKSNGFGRMIGRSPEMDKLYRMIGKAAHSAHPVLILGESGTGKEMVARAIHYSGPYRDKPFLPVDCGSLVPTLIESELFGYVKGAFTGAMQSKPGLLSIADGGTVFLDEIGELPVDLQAKLLRALQEKEIRPVGSTKTVPINVRILAATNRDLEQAVGSGSFRRDLYFRLNVLNLQIPPLRERRSDISLLAKHILDRIAQACGRTYSLSEDAADALLAYEWPGNVRELENCMEQCCAMNSGPVIHTVDLPRHVIAAGQQCPSSADPRIARLADLEKAAIVGAISQLNGDKLMAARLLGIGKTTLYRKLKEYQVAQ
jgi:two-component system response regulator HydG